MTLTPEQIKQQWERLPEDARPEGMCWSPAWKFFFYHGVELGKELSELVLIGYLVRLLGTLDSSTDTGSTKPWIDLPNITEDFKWSQKPMLEALVDVYLATKGADGD